MTSQPQAAPSSGSPASDLFRSAPLALPGGRRRIGQRPRSHRPGCLPGPRSWVARGRPTADLGARPTVGVHALFLRTDGPLRQPAIRTSRTDKKGTEVNHTEHRASKPSPSTGSLAQLRDFLRRAPGIGAPSPASPPHPGETNAGFPAALAGSRQRTARAILPRRPLALASLLATAAFMALAATPALAKEIYLQGVFHGPRSTSGAPTGVALDQANGVMYVVVNNNTIEKFDEAGSPENFSSLSSKPSLARR